MLHFLYLFPFCSLILAKSFGKWLTARVVGTALCLDLNQSFKKAPNTHYTPVTGGNHPGGQGHRGEALRQLSSLPGGRASIQDQCLERMGLHILSAHPSRPQTQRGGGSRVGCGNRGWANQGRLPGGETWEAGLRRGGGQARGEKSREHAWAVGRWMI